jgi:hypothetical protein
MSWSRAGACVAGSTSEPGCTGLLRVLELGLDQLDEDEEEEESGEANIIFGGKGGVSKE